MKIKTVLTALAAAALIALLAGCGDTNHSSKASANPTDAAFVDDMVPHHRGAIAMARMRAWHTQWYGSSGSSGSGSHHGSMSGTMSSWTLPAPARLADRGLLTQLPVRRPGAVSA